MHTHGNMAHEQLSTHVHAGTQRMCVQTYLHASSYTAAGSGKHIHECVHTHVQECLQSHECCMHAQVLAFQHICEQICSYTCTATCTHLSALAHICMHTLCTSTCAHMLAHCTSIYINTYTLICACISHAQALAHVRTPPQSTCHAAGAKHPVPSLCPIPRERSSAGPGRCVQRDVSSIAIAACASVCCSVLQWGCRSPRPMQRGASAPRRAALPWVPKDVGAGVGGLALLGAAHCVLHIWVQSRCHRLCCGRVLPWGPPTLQHGTPLLAPLLCTPLPRPCHTHGSL